MAENYFNYESESTTLNVNLLPEIRKATSNVCFTPLLFIPLNESQRDLFQRWYISKHNEFQTNELKSTIQKYLIENGLIFGLDAQTGDLFLENQVVPARSLHHAIRNQGRDPNIFTKWLAGKKYNLVSKNLLESQARKYYANLESDRFEVGFFTATDGVGNMADKNDRIHIHPDCNETFIVTRGRAVITDNIEFFSRNAGILRLHGQDRVLDLNQALNNNRPVADGVKTHINRDGKVIALSYTVPHGSYHLLPEVSSNTEIILTKHSLHRNPSPDWMRRVLHPKEEN